MNRFELRMKNLVVSERRQVKQTNKQTKKSLENCTIRFYILSNNKLPCIFLLFKM